MGQQRLGSPQGDDTSKQPRGNNSRGNNNNQNGNTQRPKQNNTVLAGTQTRRGEVFRAQRRTSEGVNLRASQHIINVPVNKSIFNGYDGRHTALLTKRKHHVQTVQSFALFHLVDLAKWELVRT